MPDIFYNQNELIKIFSQFRIILLAESFVNLPFLIIQRPDSNGIPYTESYTTDPMPLDVNPNRFIRETKQEFIEDFNCKLINMIEDIFKCSNFQYVTINKTSSGFIKNSILSIRSENSDIFEINISDGVVCNIKISKSLFGESSDKLDSNMLTHISMTIWELTPEDSYINTHNYLFSVEIPKQQVYTALIYLNNRLGFDADVKLYKKQLELIQKDKKAGVAGTVSRLIGDMFAKPRVSDSRTIAATSETQNPSSNTRTRTKRFLGI